jgi:ubiquinone/menaquinone biosynthesis C-methylase UbiE
VSEVSDPKIFAPHKAAMLDDESRLALLPEETVVRLLELHGEEDIVDLGSGTGFWSERLAERTSGTVYAVELQAEMQNLHAARNTHPNVRLVLAHVDELPLPPWSVDRALSIYTFHEAHAATGLELVGRALRPGGRLLVVDWRKSPEAADVGPPLAHRLDPEEIGALLAPWFRVLSADHLNEHLSAVVSEPLELPT